MVLTFDRSALLSRRTVVLQRVEPRESVVSECHLFHEVAISAPTCINLLLRTRSALDVFDPSKIEIPISCCFKISINPTTCLVCKGSV